MNVSRADDNMKGVQLTKIGNKGRIKVSGENGESNIGSAHGTAENSY